MSPSSFRFVAITVFASFCSIFTFQALAQKGPQPTICDRACWVARDTSCSRTISTLNRAIIHHTAGSEFATTGLNSSKTYMRNNQNYHMDTRGFCDVGYHFMVDKFGNVFEARKNSMSGLPRGAHDGNNSNSFGFTLMGWFHPDKPGGADQPNAIMISALFDVIAWRMPASWSPYGSGTYNGVTVGFLDGHRKVKATACPGDGIHGPYIGSNYNGGLARNGVHERKNPPIAPSALTATAVSQTQINLSWTDNSSVETGFKIERASASGGPWSQIATVGANVKTYSNTSLPMNTIYYYRVRAYGPLGDSTYSNTANATTQGPGPTISSHPQNQTRDPGQNVTFQVTATGTGTLTYQWRRNGVNLSNGGRISGATTATLIISALEASDVGAYTVRITDSAGTVTSAEAQLYLNAIVIFQETFESGNLNGWTITPTVNSTATALTISSTNHTPGGSKSALVNHSSNKMYRNFTPEIEGRARATFWMYDNMGGQTRWFGEVRSYAGAGYDMGGLQQLFAIGRYSVGFGTGTGNLATEEVDSTKYHGRVVFGQNTGWFNLNATRTEGWHKFEIERNGTTVDFYVDGVLARTITGANYATWDSVTIGSIGSSTVSGNAWFDDIKLEYFSAPTILTQPTGLARTVGANATFTVNATNNVEGYQWRFGGANIPGATNSSYTRLNVQPSHEGNYSVVVLNRAGTVTSANAALVVNVPPQITAQPEEGSVRTGNAAFYEVAATGTEPLSYQWFFNGTIIPDATDPQLTLLNVTTNDAGLYSVRVTNVAGFVVSESVNLNILPPQVLELTEVQLSGGKLRFNLNGDMEAEYLVQISSNLVNWVTLTNIVLSDSAIEIDVNATNQPSVFYRIFQGDAD